MKQLFSVSGLILLLFLAGCASRKEIVKFQQDLALMEDQLTAIQSQNDQLGEELQVIKRELNASREEQKRTRADILSELSTFKEQAFFLRSQLDDTGDRMSKLMQNMEARTTVPSPADSTVPTSDAALTPKTLYDSAYLDLSRKNYDLALQGFQEYLRRFPMTEYADNAQYWIGEIYYAKRDYERALAEFRKVIVNYPKGRKAPSALLKAGYCLTELKRSQDAKKAFQEVIRRFPQTEEAGLARTRLDGMQ